MTEETSNRIQQLLKDAGLLPSSKQDTHSVSNFNFNDEIILITGAAGSIGSGLANQLLHSSFKQLILVDNAETPLYYLMNNLGIRPNKKIHFLLLDIREKDSMEWLFETYKPTVIFHAAAYKHISITEQNPYEAIKLNIFATKLLADLALAHETKTFVFISTDKAVNPVSVMGMTKLIAEKYLDSLSITKSTRFTSTRFGNIFGSNGSVVPLFIKQLESGKSITITSKDATRYFIDNNKACNLILKVANMNDLETNHVTFNMEEPLKIIDLANKLIALYNSNSQIITTNLKPGEKLHESLISENEILKATNEKDIFVICKMDKTTFQPIDISTLYQIQPHQSASEIKNILTSFI